jgi:hypothetical protein
MSLPSPRDVVNWTGGLVALGLIVILGFMTWALVMRTVPAENQNALLLLIGNLTGLVGIVVAFYFGSSSAEKKQAETIDTLAKTAHTAAAANGVPALVIPPGESATATSTDGGTVIKPESTP